jgi:hypothetical protein
MVAEPERGDLEPPLRGRELPPEVVAARVAQREEDDRYGPLVGTRVEGHLAVYGMALDQLEAAHQRVADVTDLELRGDSRLAAVWQMAGRCLGFARAVLVLAHGGFGDEGLPTARSLHEANRLLDALADPEEGDLVRQWLADEDEEYVRPWQARAAGERIDERLAERMRAAGAEPVPSSVALGRELYHRMSVVAHNRRQGTEMALSEALRTMTRGRHPTVFGRAAAVTYAGAIVEEAVGSVGDALGRFCGPGFYREVLRPALESFAAVRSDMPLDDAAIQALGSTDSDEGAAVT